MNVHLTFDVEIWCNDWAHLDERFPSAFERYVFGRSAQGAFALPKTLELLDRHGLHGVFFVEPLFAARFGLEHLATIVDLIRDAGQEVQLHLHTEWVDELPYAIVEDCRRKRQHLSYFTLEEQIALISHGAQLLEQAGANRPTTFRAGSFACNHDSYKAMNVCGLTIDSSLNACTKVSGPDLRALDIHQRPAWLEGVYSVPVAIYSDGFGKLRSAQVNGSGFRELIEAMEGGAEAGVTDFVIVSHNFEMLKPGTSVPDAVVVRRFERLCAHLQAQRSVLPTTTFTVPEAQVAEARPGPEDGLCTAGVMATTTRHLEQLWRRF
jgi:peptidoglycan/xylan/chitin deacetylase (PgdA/CDA1 family)